MADRMSKSSSSSRSGLNSNSAKMISKSKLKAFNIGAMNLHKVAPKKEQEESKKKTEEEALADVYQDFVSSFEETSKGINRAWVKGGVVNPGAGEKEGKGADKNRLYKPKSKLAELAQSFTSYKDSPKPSPDSSSRSRDDDRNRLSKSDAAAKRKSNLELFKEELKNIQEERQERRKLKSTLGIAEPPDRKTRFDPSTESPQVALGSTLGLGPMDEYKGSMAYSDDSTTTNIYLGNINPNMTEIQLCEIFGRFGPLASIKIMWPRSEEERARGRNCGFVAFMNRKDGERALFTLQSKDIMGFEMKLGWGKAVPIPPHPVYIPPKLAELTQPPPPSGLPFNAQPKRHAPGKFNEAATKNMRSFTDARKRSGTQRSFPAIPPPDDASSQDNSDAQPQSMPFIQPVRPTPNDPDSQKEFEKTLKEAVVKVVIPTERPLLCLVHRMVEFVVREGPMFEAMIMNREMGNPQFRFLFDNHCPAHVYYRWKLFTILQGESPYKWRLESFKMFKGGSLWQPPPINPYTQGMPEHLIEKDGVELEMEKKIKEREREREEETVRKGQLSESQRDRFEDMLRELTPERAKIGDTMVWCLEHADAAEEIVECITESLSILQTPLPKKLARLYLVSDVLHNCSAKVPHASYYRKFFETKLNDIFLDVHEFYENIEGRLKAEQFKQRVVACFRAWEDWNVYTNDYLIKLQNVFLGLINSKNIIKDEKPGDTSSEVDGMPLDDLDGEPLDGSKLRALGGPLISDLDGEPLAEDLDGMPLEEKHAVIEKREPDTSKFVRSKWETVDEATVAAQAVTTSKWDMFEQYGDDGNDDSNDEDDLDGKPLDDDEDLDGEPLDAEPKLIQVETPPRNDRGDSFSAELQSRLTEERRAKLREIELKVVKYNDELEAGKRSRKPDMSITEQVEHYRKKLLSKEEEKDKEREREKQREAERERVREWEKAREKERKRDKERSDTPGSGRSKSRRRSRSPATPREDLSVSRSSLSMIQRYGGSASRSPSPGSTRSSHKNRSRSASPPEEPSRKRSRRSASRSPKRKKSRSRSPKRSKRSRSRSPKHRHKKHKSRRE